MKNTLINFALLSIVSQYSFAQCPSTITDSRDGEVYTTIQIGTQCWMSENLRYDVPGNSNDASNTSNPSTNYGRLYDWATVMDNGASSSANPSGVQGICPNGWHLPSDAEWNEMELVMGMSASAANETSCRGTHGINLKSISGWNNSGNGTNTTGFNALPSGSNFSGSFDFLGDYANFWSSTQKSVDTAWDRAFHSDKSGVFRGYYYKSNGNSCRCVKD